MSSERPQLLVVSLSNIGDVILTTPVMMQLLRLYPGAELTVVAGPKAAGLLQGSRSLSRFVVYDKRAPLSEKRRFLLTLRERRYEAAVDLRNTLIPFLVSARRRSSLIRLHRKVLMRDRHLDVLASMGFDISPEVPPFDFFAPADSESLDQKLSAAGFSGTSGLVIAAGAASERKRWPLDRYSEVLREMILCVREPIFLIGDSSERPYVAPLCDLAPARIFNAAGLLSLRETAALIARSPLLISNDSAAMHLGHELKRPVVAVFGPGHPEKYGRTGPLFRVIAPPVPGTEGFDGVSPERVIEACRELLARRPALRAAE